MLIREKKRIIRLLHADDIELILQELMRLPGIQVINPLFAGLCCADEKARWHAVTGMGAVVARLAEQDMEACRVIMRRLMWSLNDESGGIGWGAPEAMGEIMACHKGLADEYAHILVSYMREDGNYLEHEVLQRGLLWGVSRLSQVRPELMHKWRAGRYLLSYLDSGDATSRGLAAWSLGLLRIIKAQKKIQLLVDDPHELRFYWDRKLSVPSVGNLAEQALTRLSQDSH